MDTTFADRFELSEGDVVMEPEARVRALLPFGYTPREAAFLALVALHSGYFLGRQFAHVAGTTRGKTVTRFKARFAFLRHARKTSVGGGAHLSHVCGKPLYAALGATDHRHRRPRAWLGLKGKVMILDEVIAHPEQQFLANPRGPRRLLRDDLWHGSADVAPAAIRSTWRSRRRAVLRRPHADLGAETGFTWPGGALVRRCW